MKKKIAIGLSLILLISCTAVTFSFAATQHTAGIYGKKMLPGYSLKIKNGDDYIFPSSGIKNSGESSEKAMSFYDGAEKMEFSFNGETKTQYMVFLLKPGEDGSESSVPTNSNLIYIDQVESTDSGKVSFNVFPSELTSKGIYSVYVSSTVDGYDKVGNFTVDEWTETDYKLGDCDNDTKTNSTDALSILEHYLGISTLEGNNRLAGDVNGDGFVNSSDALYVLQYYLGLVDSFYPENLYS